jgi:hypothetical protein
VDVVGRTGEQLLLASAFSSHCDGEKWRISDMTGAVSVGVTRQGRIAPKDS